MATSCPRCGFESVEKAECPRCGTVVAFYRDALRARVGPPPATSPVLVPLPPAERPAGFWIRGVALLLDGIFLLAMDFAQGVLVRFMFGEGADDSPVVIAAGRAFQLVFGALYAILFHWLWGQTLGKMAMRIRVVMVDGGSLSLGTAVLRYAGSVLSALLFGIGYIMAGVRADKRALHDLIAGTRVERIA